jgi:hypothetical protein
MGRGCFSLPSPDILPEPVSQLGINVPKVLDGSDLKKERTESKKIRCWNLDGSFSGVILLKIYQKRKRLWMNDSRSKHSGRNITIKKPIWAEHLMIT